MGLDPGNTIYASLLILKQWGSFFFVFFQFVSLAFGNLHPFFKSPNLQSIDNFESSHTYGLHIHPSAVKEPAALPAALGLLLSSQSGCSYRTGISLQEYLPESAGPPRRSDVYRLLIRPRQPSSPILIVHKILRPPFSRLPTQGSRAGCSTQSSNLAFLHSFF